MRKERIFMTKEQLMINAILEAVGLESIKSAPIERRVHQEG